MVVASVSTRKDDLPTDMHYSTPANLVILALPPEWPYAHVAIPIYPRNNLITPNASELVFLRDVPAGSLLPDNLLAAFGTRRNMYTWQMLFEIKNRDKNVKTVSALPWCNRFAWTENGVRCRPEKWLAEVALTEDLEKDAKYKTLYQAALATAYGHTVNVNRAAVEERISLYRYMNTHNTAIMNW